MRRQTHHIQKQVLLLDFPREDIAQNWNKTASAFYYSDVLPLLNTVLDKHVPQNENYHIDCLEIDLGILYEKELQKAFLEILKLELANILKRESIEKLSVDTQEKNQLGHKLVIKEDKERLLESFYHFLDYGCLPWNCSSESLAIIEANLVLKIGIKKLASYTAFQKRLDQVTTRRRVYLQFSRTFWGEVCSHCFKSALKNLYSIQDSLISSIADITITSVTQKELKQELSDDLKDWVGTEAPANKSHWPQAYICRLAAKALPYITPIRETATFHARLQNLLKKDIQQYHGTPALITALKAFTSSADTWQETKIEQQQESMATKYNMHKPVAVEGEKTALPEQDGSTHPSSESKEKSVNKMMPIPSETDSTDTEHDASAQDIITTNVSQTPPAHQTEEKLLNAAPVAPADAQDSYLSITNEINTEAHPVEGRDQDDEKRPKHYEPHTEGEVVMSHYAPALEKEAKKQDPPDRTLADDASLGLFTSEGGGEQQADHSVELDLYYLIYAGVILTWPYLIRLFRKEGYLENNFFKNEACQQRAVHLLAYMASGQEQCEEQKLVIAKFLCAWPIQMPIVKNILLSVPEKTEADKMLSSLIINWSKLKNTSIAGLRSSFFDREGKLFKEEQQWRLVVEQKSYDMLLEHLPYTVSMIKLPWMRGILKVDWA